MNGSATIDALIEGLSRPEAYPHPTGEVRVIQTHISLVFLAGEHVYKLKKPLDLGFLDFSTQAARRAACEAEVRLNRRLADAVYLDVVEVVERGEGLAVLGSEEAGAGEPAVHMRRLPEGHTLRERLAADAAGPAEVERVAARLAEFHRGAERSAAIAEFGSFASFAGNARENFAQVRANAAGGVGVSVRASVLDRLERGTEALLARLEATIEARAARGVPCDCHGDLRTDHVYLDVDGPGDLKIVDCIEFNERFRYSDPALDVAFLVMDLEHAGRADLARLLAERWSAALDDPEALELMDLYVAYRATVRGKVDGFAAGEPELGPEKQAKAAARAEGHFLHALRRVAPPLERPALVLVGGLPGSGKSTLAARLSEELGLRWIRSDAVRKELKGLDPLAPGGEELYTPEQTARTYAECLRRAEEVLREGGRALVDATFHSAARRAPFLAAGQRLGVDLRFLLCEVSPGEARARIAGRGADPSDADLSVYERLAASFEESPG